MRDAPRRRQGDRALGQKVAGLGAQLDVPLGHTNAAYVRSHFDAMEVRRPRRAARPRDRLRAGDEHRPAGARADGRAGGGRHQGHSTACAECGAPPRAARPRARCARSPTPRERMVILTLPTGRYIAGAAAAVALTAIAGALAPRLPRAAAPPAARAAAPCVPRRRHELDRPASPSGPGRRAASGAAAIRSRTRCRCGLDAALGRAQPRLRLPRQPLAPDQPLDRPVAAARRRLGRTGGDRPRAARRLARGGRAPRLRLVRDRLAVAGRSRRARPHRPRLLARRPRRSRCSRARTGSSAARPSPSTSASSAASPRSGASTPATASG